MANHTKGGNLSHANSRKKALERYYANPNLCANCGKCISVADGEQVAQVRLKKFCDSSCSAIFSNKSRDGFKKEKRNCLFCLNDFFCSMSSKARFCSGSCGAKNRSRERSAANPRYSLKNDRLLTKGALFLRGASWQSSRSMIQKQAREVLSAKSLNESCLVCGYSKHVDACHLKDVSSFSDEALLSEINDPSNIVPLCKNHHWEFDHGLMEQEDLQKIAA